MVRDGRMDGQMEGREKWRIEVGASPKNTLLKDLSPNKIKTVVSNFYLKLY